MNLTRQGVRNLDSLPAPAPKIAVLPPSCDHRRMRFVSCGNCPGACSVECRCGLSWMLYEGTLG